MNESTLRFSRRQFLAAVGAAGLAGCRSAESASADPVAKRYDLVVAHDRPEYDTEWDAPTDVPPKLETETLIENLEIPWDLSFAGDGTLFLTERVGQLRAFDGEETRLVATPEDAVDAGSVDPGEEHDSWWVDGGEGGTLGVAAHPDYPDPPVVYVYYTAETDDGKRNQVAALDVASATTTETATPAEPTVVVEDIPANRYHNGGRIEFGPENYLWVTCGDAGERDKAQDAGTLHGTVLKLTPTGDPAPDTPDLGDDADDRIYTYGHRNPQGIVWLPDGTPVVSEHGEGGQDELNRLEAGANYGWPDTRFRDEYPDAPEVHRPLANTGGDTWAPSGSVCYTGEAVSGLTNRTLIAGLWSQQLTVGTLTPPDGTLPPVGDGTRHEGDWGDDSYTVTTHARLSGELGRLRHVEQGPDGGLYAITSNRDGRADEFPVEGDDVLVRLTTV